MTTRAERGGWDVHTHLVPDGLIRAAEIGGRYDLSLKPGQLCMCGRAVALHPICEAEKLVARVRSDDLDGAIVSPPPPLFRPDLPSDERLGYSDLLNGSVLAACKPHGDTLRPLAYLPAEDPEVATQIVAKLDAHWAGVVIGTELAGRSYADSDYHPLWRALEQSGLPIFVHPGSTPDARLDPFYLSNLLGNPVETTIVAAQLIFGGVLHQFPGLKFILAHGGGALAALVGRWQKGVTTKRPGVPALPLPPLDAARRFYVDSLVHSAAYGQMIVRVLGADRMLLGSDWPFPMGADDADADLAAFTPEIVAQIRRRNAVEVFGGRLRWPRAAASPQGAQ